MHFVVFSRSLDRASVFRTAAEAVNNYDPEKQTLHKVNDEFVDPAKTAELMDELRSQVAKRKFVK